LELISEVETREVSDADLDGVCGGTLDKALLFLQSDSPVDGAYSEVAATVWQATGQPLLGPAAPSGGLL
jgi:hypothetical protein